MDSVATMLLTNALSAAVYLDMLLSKYSIEIKFRASSINAYLPYSVGCCYVRRTKDMLSYYSLYKYLFILFSRELHFLNAVITIFLYNSRAI